MAVLRFVSRAGAPMIVTGPGTTIDTAMVASAASVSRRARPAGRPTDHVKAR
jgi:hypothetical protein